jgi:cyclopropane-fatty-acyl-phospholipid synthase
MSAEQQVLGRRVPRVGRRLPARIRALLALLDGCRHGSVSLQLPDGDVLRLGQGEPIGHWLVRDLAAFDRAIATGDIGLGEAWMDGQWDTDALPALLTWLSRNRDRLGERVHGRALPLLAYRLWHLLRANTRRGSRRNIEAHYDLGNDFYALWLDPGMTYSAACFEAADEPLEQAQLRKYRRILNLLDARPGQQLLEIGCGWGGLAEVAVREYGCTVRGLTLSPAQRAYAQARARAGGWADRADFALCDYRDETGRYDHIVSIEMIEAVGERFWPTYFERIATCLVPGGSAVLQAITIDDALFERYRRGTDFIQRYVFPGGMLPSPQRMRAEAAGAGLRQTGVSRFGADYARTLQRWADGFDAVQAQVRAQGFDARFIRLWQFYLAYCEAGFRTGDLDVCHAAFEHGSD